MKVVNDLTILLTLKGRKSFTKRWLDWMSEHSCPFPIVIADGDWDKSYTRALLKDEHYSCLTIEYREYPEDSNVEAFVRKFSDAVSRVETKYLICADNDDFILIENLIKARNFLQEHEHIDTLALPHYRFSIENDSTDVDSKIYCQGSDINFKMLRPLDNKAFFAKNILSRLKESIRVFPSDYFYYGIHKTKNFKRSTAITAQKSMNLIFFWERFLTYTIAIIGNISAEKSLEPFVVRQEATSVSAINLVEVERLSKLRYSSDWVENYSSFLDGLCEFSKEYQSQNLIKFRFFFIMYFSYNIHVRIVHGIIGSFFSSYKKLYETLVKILGVTRGKHRLNVNQQLLSQIESLKRLESFLRSKSR